MDPYYLLTTAISLASIYGLKLDNLHEAEPAGSSEIYKAGGQWNTMEISAQGSRITVRFNGQITASLDDAKFPAGPFALQFGSGVKGGIGGPIKWRNVQIRPL